MKDRDKTCDTRVSHWIIVAGSLGYETYKNGFARHGAQWADSPKVELQHLVVLCIAIHSYGNYIGIMNCKLFKRMLIEPNRGPI